MKMKKKIILSRYSSSKDGISAGATEPLVHLDIDINIVIVTCRYKYSSNQKEFGLIPPNKFIHVLPLP